MALQISVMIPDDGHFRPKPVRSVGKTGKYFTFLFHVLCFKYCLLVINCCHVLFKIRPQNHIDFCLNLWLKLRDFDETDKALQILAPLRTEIKSSVFDLRIVSVGGRM